MSKTIAIGVFGYNRPEILKNTINALESYISKSSYHFDVYVFIDGPKNKSDAKKQDLIRELAIIFPDFVFSFGNTNQGLKHSILLGVDKLAQTYKYFAVFEDDILIQCPLDPLIRIATTTRIFENYSSVCFYSPLGVTLLNIFNEFCMKKTYRMQCWGWITNQQNWKTFRKNYNKDSIKKIDSTNYKYQVGEDSFSRLLLTINNQVDLWACEWLAFNFLENKPALLPNFSFVRNVGMSEGTNAFSVLSSLKEDLNNRLSRLKHIQSAKNSIEISELKKVELALITNRLRAWLF